MVAVLFCLAVVAIVAVFGLMISERVDSLVTRPVFAAGRWTPTQLGRLTGQQCRQLVGHG